MSKDNIVEQLRKNAIDASLKAYSPYSKAQVGCALTTADNTIYSGCNVENSSYGATICAERVAILKAVSDGHQEISKIYIYSEEGWPPCGMCRQVISEFASNDLIIFIGDKAGNEKKMSFKDIMPLAFTPDKLDK